MALERHLRIALLKIGNVFDALKRVGYETSESTREGGIENSGEKDCLRWQTENEKLTWH